MSVELHHEFSDQEVKQKSIKMLESVGLGDRLNYYPQNLSGGQKQR
ncbi:MAG TPA: ABC transporter, partial [Cyanothece sp. UBA12306]|nr:ABC transporter [Cyanothece sp. UBA12306]